MGIVYEAIDRELGSRVALKTLRSLDATALYRFKREFRGLAELAHPNLIPLYELVAEGDNWFFTMELIQGVDFRTYVRSGEDPRGDDSSALAGAEGPPPDGSAATIRDQEAASAPSGATDAATDAADPSGSETTEARDRHSDDAMPTTDAPARGLSLETTEAAEAPSHETIDVIPGQRTGGSRPVERLESGAVHLDRLRPALRQLAEGVRALHRAGKLHRDIKPSNVLVAPGGRVLLLDFGLVADRDDVAASLGTATSAQGPSLSGEDSIRTTESGRLMGTVAYMAPEQAMADPASEASDWYAVGVVLYEALTGRLPYEGPPRRILRMKQRGEAVVPPAELVPGVPEDLDTLCRALLRPEAAQRPTGEQVLAALRSHAAGGQVVGFDDGLGEFLPFVGREPHLEVLESAYDEAVGGRTVVVEVRGRSGVGKTSLVHRFLERLTRDRRAVVLTGRCYEQESVPYKGLDSLVDSLSRYLLRLSDAEVRSVMPRSIAGLARLFPVLQRVDAVTAAAELAPTATADPQELRRNAFAALRGLLTSLAVRQPLVLVLDDLQWGDEDSAALLADLLRPPDPPRLLLLATARSEHAENPCLRALHAPADPSRLRIELELEPLGLEEARRLALRILGERGPEARARAERIARESQGLPYFVAELTRQIAPTDEAEAATAEPAPEGELERVLWRRFRRLGPQALALLEVVAAANRPLRLRDAIEASGLGAEGPPILAALRAAHLLRRCGSGLEGEIETFHDRIRTAVLTRMNPESLRGVHQRLAETLALREYADAESLAAHYLGAGRIAEACEATVRAADGAARALAFDRAAKLYRTALELRPEGPASQRLRVELAESLANAGRGAEAARAFLAAAAGAAEADALDLQRRAAYQFCISGRIDEGLDVLHHVMRSVGLRLPGSPGRAMVSVLTGRLWLSVRGLRHRSRPASSVAPRDLARIDVTWSASTGLTVIDTLRAADLQTRNLLLALRVGEPNRLARALAWEAAHAGVPGSRASDEVAGLLATARTLAPPGADAYLDGLIALAEGAGAYFRGDFRSARDAFQESIRLFRERCTGVAWELGTAQSFLVWSLNWLGELGELARQVPVLLREARQRDDHYLETNLSSWGAILAGLAADDVDGTERALRETMARWTRGSFHSQHMLEILARIQLNLYRGDGPGAWAGVAHTERAMRRSGLMRVQVVRVAYHYLRALARLAAAARFPDARPLEAGAASDARRLARENAPYAQALAHLVLAALADRRGGDVTTRLATVADELAAANLATYAAAARYRLGRRLGDEAGRRLADEAVDRLASQGVAAPLRMFDAHAPEFRQTSR